MKALACAVDILGVIAGECIRIEKEAIRTLTMSHVRFVLTTDIISTTVFRIRVPTTWFVFASELA